MYVCMYVCMLVCMYRLWIVCIGILPREGQTPQLRAPESIRCDGADLPKKIMPS